MPLTSTRDLLRSAQSGGYGIGAFNVIGLEHAEAVVAAAEAERSPVIVQLSQNTVDFRRGTPLAIGAACRALAAAAGVPVALHLDHATDWPLCESALDLGFGSVMLDLSDRPLETNAATTAEIARRVHARGAAIEAELGVVGGKEGVVSSEQGKTDPAVAAWYVGATGVDALAVAVGTSHGMVEQTADVDFPLLSRLRAAVGVPMVLHGASGVPDAALPEAIRRGIVKVNTATELNKAFTGAIRTHLGREGRGVDPRPYLREARAAMEAVTRARIRLLGSSGRA